MLDIFFETSKYIYIFYHFSTRRWCRLLNPSLCGRSRPVYAAYSISWLLMAWQHKEPGHQQPWYWPSNLWPGDTRSQGISSHCIELVIQEYSGFSIRKVKISKKTLLIRHHHSRLKWSLDAVALQCKWWCEGCCWKKHIEFRLHFCLTISVAKNSTQILHTWGRHQMDTFSVLLSLCAGNSPGHQWIPLTKASDVELWKFSLICASINGWDNNREASDLKCHRAHYDVTVMS